MVRISIFTALACGRSTVGEVTAIGVRTDSTRGKSRAVAGSEKKKRLMKRAEGDDGADGADDADCADGRADTGADTGAGTGAWTDPNEIRLAELDRAIAETDNEEMKKIFQDQKQMI